MIDPVSVLDGVCICPTKATTERRLVACIVAHCIEGPVEKVTFGYKVLSQDRSSAIEALKWVWREVESWCKELDCDPPKGLHRLNLRRSAKVGDAAFAVFVDRQYGIDRRQVWARFSDGFEGSVI